MLATKYHNIRISPDTKAALQDLAKREGKPMQAVLDEAVERYRRDRLLDEANAAYARLQADPDAWKEELAERQLWETTLMDGLGNE
jgi:predicted DNA-binding protein